MKTVMGRAFRLREQQEQMSWGRKEPPGAGGIVRQGKSRRAAKAE